MHERVCRICANRPRVLLLSAVWIANALSAQQPAAWRLGTPEGHTSVVLSAVFSPDGRTVVTASSGNTSVRLWALSAGTELVRRLVLDSSDWVAVAPDGRFDGTERGMRQMYYSDGRGTIGLDAFFEKFYSPGLIGQLLAGEPYRGPDIRKGFGLGPSVRILSPRDGETVQANALVAVAVKDEGGGAEDVRLYHNGALVGGTAREFELRCPERSPRRCYA